MVAALFVALVAVTVAVQLASRAGGADVSRCERFSAASVLRGQVATGSGPRVAVLGDSWAAGLGLTDPIDSWPSRLTGRVRVAGFSGSGFSRDASGCGASVSFAARAPGVLAHDPDLVVVEGGLNDYDRSDAEIRRGFARLMQALEGRRVVVVGPAAAPARAASVARVDVLLEELSDEHGAAYVRTSGWTLPYLADRLHLTEAGHREFGDRVAAALAALS